MTPALDLDQHLPAIAAGDADAFGRWLAGAEHRLRAALRTFAARVDTEAVLQDALLRVWQVAPSHVPDGRPDSLLRLAARIARNRCVDELRRARAEPTDIDDLDRAMTAVASPARRPPDPFLRRAIEACREQLAGKPAEVLTARLVCGGCDPDEVLAARLGMRLNTFLQNFTRARKLLAECLQRRRVDLDAELS